MPRRRWFVLTLTAMLLAAPTVAAQGYREAEIEFNRGELLLEMKDYPRAVFAFNKAWGIQPDPRYLAGLTRAHYAKGDMEKALIRGETYLERVPADPDPRVVEIVRAVREKFDGVLGRVDVRVFPTGGKVTFIQADGNRETVPADDALLSRWLPLGDLMVIYEKAGFAPANSELKLNRGKTAAVALTLQEAEGVSELVVDSNVRDARVYLDGREAGRTPFKTKVEAGDHIVQVWAENHLAWTGVVDAPAQQAVAVTANLVPAASRVGTLPVPQVEIKEQSRFWTLSTWGWITLGAGVAALGGAGYAYYTFDQKWAKAVAASGDEQQRLANEATPYYNLSIAGFAAGGALVSGGLLMVLLDSGDELEESATFELLTLSPGVLPDGGVALDAAFTF